MDAPNCKGIASQWRALADEIEAATYDTFAPFSINFKELREKYPESSMQGIARWSAAPGRYLYRLSIRADQAKVFGRAFDGAKAAKVDKRDYSRRFPDSSVLYVGRASDLAQRLREHFGYGIKRRYSLHMCTWLPDIEGEVRIEAWRFDPAIAMATFQAVEDGFWAANRPMFGRQGSL